MNFEYMEKMKQAISTAHCQNCHKTQLVNNIEKEYIINLRPIPAVDMFMADIDSAYRQELYNLSIFKCINCDLVQIVSSPPSSKFYDEYIYTSSSSTDMKKNFLDLSKTLKIYIDPSLSDQIKLLDIGCNDALLLSTIKSQYPNIRLYGTDPSPVSKHSNPDFFTLHSEYFPGKQTSMNGPYDLIIGTNSLAHIPDIGRCFREIKRLLTPKGVFVMEVSDLFKMAKIGAWDYIYHEHLYYYTESTLVNILCQYDLVVTDVQEIPTKGGSLRLVVRHKSPQYLTVHNSYNGTAGVNPLNSLRESYKSTLQLCDSYESKLGNSSRVYGYGACATASVAMSQHSFFRNLICLIDDNPQRFALYSPHWGVQVKSLSDIVFDGEDIIIVYAWRFINNIAKNIAKHCLAKSMPTPRILNAMHLNDGFYLVNN